MNCLVCGNDNLKTVDTVVSEFVSDRIKKHPSPKTKLCFCEECTFAFYDYRFTDEESQLLYADYRGHEYQSLRQKYEYWYSAKVNEALNNDTTALSEQQRVIQKIIKENIRQEIKIALDYGGNEGRTFVDSIGTEKKYVFDISGVPTVPGVENISDPAELKNHTYDFIMCNMLFEHLPDPVRTLDELKAPLCHSDHLLREIGEKRALWSSARWEQVPARRREGRWSLAPARLGGLPGRLGTSRFGSAQ